MKVSVAIWDRLWSPPEIDSAEAARDYDTRNLRGQFGGDALPTPRHAFAHIDLDSTPLAQLHY